MPLKPAKTAELRFFDIGCIRTKILTRSFKVVALVIKSKGSGSTIPNDVDLVPVAVVQSPVRSPEPESPAAQVQVQVQETLEQLKSEEISLESWKQLLNVPSQESNPWFFYPEPYAHVSLLQHGSYS